MAYCTLQDARRQLRPHTKVNDLDLALSLAEAAQAIDDATGLWFDERLLTLGFNGEVGATNSILYLDDYPLQVVNSLLNGDGTTVAAANYTLLPIGSRYPKEGLRLNVGSYWRSPYQTTTPGAPYPPFLDASYAVDAISITGLWAFHRRYATAWKLTPLTVSGAVLASATALPLSGPAAFNFDVGSLLKVTRASDSAVEYMTITADITNVAASSENGFATAAPDVDRGVNGSTALAFVGGETIAVWQMEPLMAWAAREITAASMISRENATGAQMSVSGYGSITIADIPDKVWAKLRYPYFSWRRGVQWGGKR